MLIKASTRDICFGRIFGRVKKFSRNVQEFSWIRRARVSSGGIFASDLSLVEAVVAPLLFQQSLVRPLFKDAVIFQNQDQVEFFHPGEVVRNDQGGLALLQSFEGVVNEGR